MSPSTSVALTLPVTTPVEAFGVPTTGVLATGLAFDGLTTTVTDAVAVPPCPSATTTVKESARSPAVAPSAAARCRAGAVGV